MFIDFPLVKDQQLLLTSNGILITQKKIKFNNRIWDFDERKACWLKKVYELIIGNKVFSDKKKINWESLVDQFTNEERGNWRETTEGDLRLSKKLNSLLSHYY